MQILICSISLTILVLSVVATCHSETFHIVPVNSTWRCEGEPCITLDQLASEIVNRNFSSITMYFQSGKHTLKHEQTLNVSGIRTVKMIGTSLDVELCWLQNTTLEILNVQDLVIEKITFLSSTGRLGLASIKECGNFLLGHSTFKKIGLLVLSNSTTVVNSNFEGEQSSAYVYDPNKRCIVFTKSLYIVHCTFDFTVDVLTADFSDNFSVYIDHSSFNNNDGRGIIIYRHVGGHIYITNCAFNDNRGVAFEIIEAAKVIIVNSTFINNTAGSYGSIASLESRHMEIRNCTFSDNYRSNIVLNARTNQLSFIDSKVLNNECDRFSPASLAATDSLQISGSTFNGNRGFASGGISIYPDGNMGKVHINDCTFTANYADSGGGAISFQNAPPYQNIEIVTIVGTTFTNNTSRSGGTVIICNDFEIVNCTFLNNYALVKYSSTISICSLEDPQLKTVYFRNTMFTNNTGASVMSIYGSRAYMENTSFIGNSANKNSRVLVVSQSSLIVRQFTFSYNKGYAYFFNSRLDITGPMRLTGNTNGAILAVQSRVYTNSTEEIVISNNTASSGGGLLLRESELVIGSLITISDNRAQIFGGGIYAFQSVIAFKSDKITRHCFITNNYAGQSGGGVYTVASTIKISYFNVTIGSNTAQLSGGGLYLQENSKIYIQKQEDESRNDIVTIRLIIVNNFAVYGGGIYVADNSTAGRQQCQQVKKTNSSESSVTSECFIQTIKLYWRTAAYQYRLTNTFIINNKAESGSALYGGLLDRCTASEQAEIFNEKVNGYHGLQYFDKIVSISNGSSIASDPVQVIFCNKASHFTIQRRKGEAFKIKVMAIDQVRNPVNATIHSSVITESGVGRLKEGQAEQTVGNQCTELEYNVFSQDNSAQVELYADGPCTNLGISRQTFTVNFLPCTCPVGLQPSQSPIECKCECDQKLQAYQIRNCSQQAGTIQLETNIWIGVANSTNGTGYIIDRCPFDYCVEKPVKINLGSSQEVDRQCAFNRSGFLCGQCTRGLSLVFATSNCKECSNIYLLLLLPFALAGIGLVGFILFFNITIPTGTIHGLIFYSNILPSNYFAQPNALTVFISWVNLDLGIETCFYNGMSSQAKVLLQLVLPAYLFLLVFLIIILCRLSNFFALLLSNRNPVAALCTLIFLSYSRLIQFIIAALQSTVLDLPGDLKRSVWLYDANIYFYTPSRIPHFLAAAIIITAGGLLTLQLFFAQWFPRCSKWKLMKWTRNTKYTAIMDAYHAPFTRKHRYWVGLLLFALIIHNTIVSTTTDEFLPVLSMGCIGIGLLIVKLQSGRIYKSSVNNLLENVFLLNLVLLAFGTLYVETKHTVKKIANVSMGLSACFFLLIICYHSYKHVYLQSRVYRRHKVTITTVVETVREKLKHGLKQKDAEELVTNVEEESPETHYTALTSHHRRDLELLAPITTEDYKAAPSPSRAHHEVTHTVVEITK